ncbi:MAG: TetR family transcriptional regulator, partial [Cystobacter sp.]
AAAPELEKALRRSQELSGQLTGLAQSLAGAESEAERRHLALHTLLSEELARVRAAWDATTERQARAGLLERMRTLRTERDAVRAALPASQVPALPAEGASDDAEDLLEQADALRDTQDKVNQRLQALRSRLTELREERELERRMSDFLGEESMFDEQDRRLRVRLDSSTGAISVNHTVRDAPTEYRNAAPDVGDPMVYQPGLPTSQPSPSNGGSPPPMVDPSQGRPSTPPPSHLGADNRPQVGAAMRAQELASDLAENPKLLEQETARLESLGRELGARADTLERRARELR